MINKAIFLDRDGTINIDKGYLYKIQEFEWIPGALDALRNLSRKGYLLIIITNQSGIARGIYSEDDFMRLTDWMLNFMEKNGIYITKVYYCPHHPQAVIPKYRTECNCRKPQMGLFWQAVEENRIDLRLSYAAGDRLRDCSICKISECKGVVVGKKEKSETIRQIRNGLYKNIKYASSLYEFAQMVPGNENNFEIAKKEI